MKWNKCRLLTLSCYLLAFSCFCSAAFLPQAAKLLNTNSVLMAKSEESSPDVKIVPKPKPIKKPKKEVYTGLYGVEQ